MTNYIGNTPGLGQRVVWRFSATEGQTVFTGTDTNAFILNFTSYEIDVFVNGILVIPLVDYVKSNNNTITFSSPLSALDDVVIVGVALFNVADTYTRAEIENIFGSPITQVIWRFTSAQDQDTFTGNDVDGLLLNMANYLVNVYVNGVRLILNADYTRPNDSEIIIGRELNVNDEVIIVGMKKFNIADTYTRNEIETLLAESRIVWRYVATSAQTVFTGLDENGVNLAFANTFIDVFVNGNLLTDGVDFTKSGNNTVTIALPLNVDDEVIIIGIRKFAFVDTYTKDEVDGFLEFAGGGFFKGNTGQSGNPNGRDDIFRINNTVLNANVTILSTENASAAGPLTIANNVVLTVEGNLVIL
jgi:hypothetical protein